MNYIIITPAYNEEDHIDRTLKSIIKQTILPEEWIIVNDGSKDNTAKIVRKYSEQYPWIKLYSFEKEDVPFGAHVHANFYKGYSKITYNDWDVIVKLDADLDIDRNDFFEYQLNKMKEWPELGICSGITYSEINGQKVLTKGRHYWRTGGAMKVYRRACFDQIGGIAPMYGWDGLDEYKAMFNGWKTRTFFELPVNHLGKKRAVSREKSVSLIEAKAISLYQRGYPVEFILLKTINYIVKKDFKYAKAFYKSYMDAKKRDIKQLVNRKEKSFNRKIQYLRILDSLLPFNLL